VKPPNEEDLLATKFELGGDVREGHRVDDRFVNPGLREPGPVVLALGCDTGDLDIGFAGWVETLQRAGAEIVVSTLSPVPGKEVALFVERMFTVLPKQFDNEPTAPLRRGAHGRATCDGRHRGRARAVRHRVRGRRRRARRGALMITVDMLPRSTATRCSSRGGTKKAPHRMLIDAGLGSAFPEVKSKLESFDGDVDLFVVTHVDTDHIGGAVKLLRDTTLVRALRQVWFNGPPAPREVQQVPRPARRRAADRADPYDRPAVEQRVGGPCRRLRRRAGGSVATIRPWSSCPGRRR
jgi:hypothetical protein